MWGAWNRLRPRGPGAQPYGAITAARGCRHRLSAPTAGSHRYQADAWAQSWSGEAMQGGARLESAARAGARRGDGRGTQCRAAVRDAHHTEPHWTHTRSHHVAHTINAPPRGPGAGSNRSQEPQRWSCAGALESPLRNHGARPPARIPGRQARIYLIFGFSSSSAAVGAQDWRSRLRNCWSSFLPLDCPPWTSTLCAGSSRRHVQQTMCSAARQKRR